MSFSLILLAAGNSNRFKSKIPKPYHKLGGKTLLEISLSKFKQFKEIKKTVVVINKNHKKYLANLKIENTKFIKGGISRSKSTYNALKFLIKHKNIRNVLIHDAARPNFSKKLIRKVIHSSKKFKTIIPILKLQDALKRKKKSYFTSKKRDNYFLTQTPQSFNLKEIFNLHKSKKNNYLDDDSSLLKNFKNTKLINGEKRNFKITDQNDFENLKNYLKFNTYVGIGFDVHRLVPKRPLFLGGMKIPSKLGTLGHSDGDPLLHAITDAILGACQMGDIGEIFSDKNKKFKNISSVKILKKIIQEVNLNNFYINNIDVNIIIQKPKISKFKKKLLLNISKLCKISPEKINIKAKTTEKLGVIGKEKAIATEVILSVIKYD